MMRRKGIFSPAATLFLCFLAMAATAPGSALAANVYVPATQPTGMRAGVGRPIVPDWSRDGHRGGHRAAAV